MQLPEEISSKLKCRYVTHNNSFLLIAPFKVEEAYHKPNIWIFHDVMSDSEIETIKKLSLPRVSYDIKENFFVDLAKTLTCSQNFCKYVLHRKK